MNIDNLSLILLISAAWLGGCHYVICICIHCAAITCRMHGTRRGINTQRLFDFIHPLLSGPGCVSGCGAVIYGSILEVYMRHPQTDPSAHSQRGP